MTYHAGPESTRPMAPVTAEDLCFECGEEIKAAAVSYDGHVAQNSMRSLYFHPACAALVGQRLICDGFPNRRKS